MNKKNVRTIMEREGLGRLNGNFVVLYDPIELLPIASQGAGTSYNFDLTGTGTVPAPTFSARGGILMLTRSASAADNDRAGLYPLAGSTWGRNLNVADNKTFRLETVVQAGADITETAIAFGFKLTDPAVDGGTGSAIWGTDANQALFLFETDAITLSPTTENIAAGMTTWYTLASVAGVDDATNTGVTVAASTNYLLAVEIGTDRIPRFFINNIQVAVGTTALPTNADLHPFFTIASRASAGAQKSHTIRYVKLLTSI